MDGTKNPADALTKYVDAGILHRSMRDMGLELRGGRPEAAPEAMGVKDLCPSGVSAGTYNRGDHSVRDVATSSQIGNALRTTVLTSGFGITTKTRRQPEGSDNNG